MDSKKFNKKAAAKDWQKNFGKCWLALPIANHRLINSKMKPNEAITNIDEHNKMNSVFFRIFFVPRTSSMLFDDGKVHCRAYDLRLSQIYKQTIDKLSFESELDF